MGSWQRDAKCLGLDHSLFFEDYENSVEISKKVDILCSNCDVRKACMTYGVSLRADGVWGGYYLVNGEVDEKRNAHKDDQIKRKLEYGKPTNR